MLCSPYVRLAHDFSSPPTGHTFRGPYTHDHVLHYFKAGSGEYHCADEHAIIAPGLVALHSPGAAWSFHFVNDKPAHMLNIIFDVVERDDSYFPFPHAALPERPHLETLETLTGTSWHLPSLQWLLVPAEFENLFAELHGAMLQETTHARLRRKALMLEILALLYRNAAEQHGDVAMVHERIVAGAVAILHEFVVGTSSITLHELATQLAVSRSLLCRIFQQRMGVSPMRYLIRLKIERAQVELLLNLRSIKETAALLGFASVHHFTRVFCQHTGYPPGRFLRMSR